MPYLYKVFPRIFKVGLVRKCSFPVGDAVDETTKFRGLLNMHQGKVKKQSWMMMARDWNTNEETE